MPNKKVRYCETKLQSSIPCGVEWWSGTRHPFLGPMILKSCKDEPMEENCRNIIEAKDGVCPCCGRGGGEGDTPGEKDVYKKAIAEAMGFLLDKGLKMCYTYSRCRGNDFFISPTERTLSKAEETNRFSCICLKSVLF